jgi:hypothetical protein
MLLSGQARGAGQQREQRGDDEMFSCAFSLTGLGLGLPLTYRQPNAPTTLYDDGHRGQQYAAALTGRGLDMEAE